MKWLKNNFVFLVAAAVLTVAQLVFMLHTEGEIAGRAMSDSPSDYHSAGATFWTIMFFIAHSPFPVLAMFLGSGWSHGGWFLVGTQLANSALWGMSLPWIVRRWRRRRLPRPAGSRWAMFVLAGALTLLPAAGFVADLWIPPADSGIVSQLFRLFPILW
ncbi:MAG: hypothetical protein NT031_18070 [Planctomycetota bacterium]|nr:hypothetical protein [Planctomycetota bacterium]